MVLATLLWGATFVVLRDSIAAFPPAPLVFARFAVASVVYSLLLLARLGTPARAAWAAGAPLAGALAGGLAAGGYLFQAIGIGATSAGSSAFLTCAGTLLAGVFAWPLLGQRPSPLLALGLTLALAGSALLSLRAGFRMGEGELWTLLGAVLFALQILAIARAGPGSSPLVVAGVQSVTIAVVLAPWAGAALRAFAALDPAGRWRFAYLALAGSVIAPLLQIAAQRALSPGRVGLLFALEPVFALGFAVSVGAERFVARWWWGAALILGAVLLVEAPASRAEASARPASG